jgi:gas vesicle protein GvpA/GvpJ/GvpM family
MSMSMTVAPQRQTTHSIHSATLADVLERILDKGLVIAGDIKVKLVDIELLTIQIRLVIASVDKAREMGMDWWMSNADFRSKPALVNGPPASELAELKARIAQLEAALPPGGQGLSTPTTAPVVQASCSP